MLKSINSIVIKVSTYCNLDCIYCYICHRDSKNRVSVFNQTKEFRKLLETLDIEPKLHIHFSGGECSLFTKEIRSIVKELNKLERTKDTKINYSLVTNGTNIDSIIELFDDGVIDPWSTKVSWDGIYSASKSRKPKDNKDKFTDRFFREELIEKLGKSGYGKYIILSMGLSKEIVENLSDSFRYAVESGCDKVEFYPIYFREDPLYYRDKAFMEDIRNQLESIADLYIEHPFGYENWNNLYYTEIINSGKPIDLSCDILGHMLYVNEQGKIYPCVIFNEYEHFRNDFCLGSVKDGIEHSKAKMIDLVLDSFEGSECSKCDEYHCSRCPANIYYIRKYGGITSGCYLNPIKRIEREVFLKKAPELDEETRKKIIGRMNFTTNKSFIDNMIKRA